MTAPKYITLPQWEVEVALDRFRDLKRKDAILAYAHWKVGCLALWFWRCGFGEADE